MEAQALSGSKQRYFSCLNIIIPLLVLLILIPPCRAQQLLGDVSGNGSIGSYDASLTARNAVGLVDFTPQQEAAGDVTGNGSISVGDASWIARKVADPNTKFPAEIPGAWWKPAPGTSWQIQFNGSTDTSFDVTMYDIDLYDSPQSLIDQLHRDGRIVICYFSAGSWEDWRPDSNNFPESVKGRSNGWPGEQWLDIRRLDILGSIMEARMDLAVAKGCDGVDPDNVDGYTNNTGFPLSYADQLAYNRFLAEKAHQRNLSVGLKNDLEQIVDLEPYFDWALNESCFHYNECQMLLPFINAGKAVFGLEYEYSASSFCPQANSMNMDFLRKNMSLDAWREPCR